MYIVTYRNINFLSYAYCTRFIAPGIKYYLNRQYYVRSSQSASTRRQNRKSTAVNFSELSPRFLCELFAIRHTADGEVGDGIRRTAVSSRVRKDRQPSRETHSYILTSECKLRTDMCRRRHSRGAPSGPTRSAYIYIYIYVYTSDLGSRSITATR